MSVCYCLRYRKLGTLHLHLVNSLWINIRSCNIVIVTVQDLAAKPEFACAPFVLRRCKRLQRPKAKVSIILGAKRMQQMDANSCRRASKWRSATGSSTGSSGKCSLANARAWHCETMCDWTQWRGTLDLFIPVHNVEAHRESWMQPWTSMNSIYSVCMHLQVWAAVWRCCCRGPKMILII